MNRINIRLLIAVSCCATVLHVQADTHHVDLAGSHTAPYTSWATAATNIQAAVDAAVGGDTVLVTNGTYLLAAEIVVSEEILVKSVNGPDVTIVDGGGATRCFKLGVSACVVSGLTITNGSTAAIGGGGGVWCTSNLPMVTNCTISGNTSYGLSASGGGMVNGTANNCIIMGNTVIGSIGGGKTGGTANNCLIIGNTATGSGGNGGGMSSVTANNCTIVGNTAGGVSGGGGLYVGTANNCIIWYNTASTNTNLSGGTQTHTSSPDVTHGSDGNITNVPAFLDKDNGNYRLYDASPCIDSGTNALVEGSIDLDGNPRILNGAVDMGAYEFILTSEHYVALGGSHTAPYSSWVTAATNIQTAVNAAAGGDTVHITNGTYLLTSAILVTSDILIESVNGPDVTIVDGGGVTLCFNLEDSACVVSGLTITNGNNSGFSGGGIDCATVTPVVTNCIISGNTSYVGGGMYNGTANDCTISGNLADGQGGGMQFGAANNCIISGNTADHGGGIRYVVANNCLISGNTADGGSGGGIFSGTAYNCTVVSNTASGAFGGGGIYVGTANNCIVWDNTASTNNNLSGGTQTHTCSPDATHGSDGNITNAPVFVDLPGGDYQLAFNSPCINAGTNDYWVTSTDLAGANRIVDSTVDIGAYEYDAATADFDGDGMTDYWETLYFGNATNAMAAANADLDLSNNGDEFIAGTDPTNSASFFAITNTSPITEGFVVQWEAISGRVYSVNWTDDLTNGFQVLEAEIAYPTSSYTDTLHTAETEAFYFLEVQLAE